MRNYRFVTKSSYDTFQMHNSDSIPNNMVGTWHKNLNSLHMCICYHSSVGHNKDPNILGYSYRVYFRLILFC